MHHPENIRHLLWGRRMINDGGLALIFFCGVSFCSLDAAVVKFTQDGVGTVASSTGQTPDRVSNLEQHQNVAVTNAAPAARSLTPIPEISVLFPILGLVVAIALTQVLRRRRISRRRAGSPNESARARV